jgi:uncharacterized membrane protein YfcA
MWQQYKKNAVQMQLLIAGVSACAWWQSHHWEAAVAFFVPMQIGAVLGAMWGVRLVRLRSRFRG